MCYWEPVTNCTIQIVSDGSGDGPAPSGQGAQLAAEREQEQAGIDGIMHDFSPPPYAHHGTFWFQVGFPPREHSERRANSGAQTRVVACALSREAVRELVCSCWER